MGPILTVLSAVCFGLSLLPFLFPGAVIGLFGALLNGWIGALFVSTFRVEPGLLITSGPDGAGLTLQGVLAFYVPLLLVLVSMQRGR